MKFLILFLSCLCMFHSAHAGGVEGRPIFLENAMLAMQTAAIDSNSPALNLKKYPYVSDIEVKIDNTLLGARMIETTEGGVEYIMASHQIPLNGTWAKAESKPLASLTSIKYLSESPEAVYIQINNSNTVLEIKDAELMKSKTLWEQVGTSAQSTQWIITK